MLSGAEKMRAAVREMSPAMQGLFAQCLTLDVLGDSRIYSDTELAQVLLASEDQVERAYRQITGQR